MIRHLEFCTAEQMVTTILTTLSEVSHAPWNTILTTKGYPESRISEGYQLADSIQIQLQNIQADFGKTLAETTLAHQHYRSAKASFEITRRIAEIAFRHCDLSEKASIFTQYYSSWIENAIHFYKQIIQSTTRTRRMQAMGYTSLKLQEEMHELEVLQSEPVRYPQLTISSSLHTEIEILAGWAHEFSHVISDSSIFTDPLFRNFQNDII